MTPMQEMWSMMLGWPLGLAIGFLIFTIVALVPTVREGRDPVRFARHYRMVYFFRSYGRPIVLLFALAAIAFGLWGNVMDPANRPWNLLYLGFCVFTIIFGLTCVLAGLSEQQLDTTMHLWRKQRAPIGGLSF